VLHFFLFLLRYPRVLDSFYIWFNYAWLGAGGREDICYGAWMREGGRQRGSRKREREREREGEGEGKGGALLTCLHDTQTHRHIGGV
jgi:hypothetical protein